MDLAAEVISGETKLIGLLGHPVAHSLSPAMQNAAFAALALDFAYVPLDVAPERLEDALAGLVALGFVGANVTTPHKLEVARLVKADVPSVNTLVVRDGVISGATTDAAILVGLAAGATGDRGRRRRGGRVPAGAAARARLLPARRVAAGRARRRSRRARDDACAIEVLFELEPEQTLVDLPYPETATAAAARVGRSARSRAASTSSSRRARRRSSSGPGCRRRAR